MSQYCKTVHSFEPNPVIFEDLEKTLPKIIKNIKLYNLALSDKNDQVNLKIPIRNPKFKEKNYEEYYRMGLATIHNNKTFENFKKLQLFEIFKHFDPGIYFMQFFKGFPKIMVRAHGDLYFTS